MTDMQIRVQTTPFDLATEEAQLRVRAGDAGALVAFQGMVRAFDQAVALTHLFVQHYPGVTEREIQRLLATASERWVLQAVQVIHRVGVLAVGEAIVLVLVAARHRQAAFEAASYVMDQLKTQAPFWKQEHFADGSARWVALKAQDVQAAARW